MRLRLHNRLDLVNDNGAQCRIELIFYDSVCIHTLIYISLFKEYQVLEWTKWIYITKTSLFNYTEKFSTKKWKFSD